MAKLILLRPQFASGTLTAEFGSSATTAESAEFAGLPAFGTDEFIRLVLDPDGENGVPEVVDFTGHTSSDDEMTCTSAAADRGRESYAGGGAARVHPVGTKWRYALTMGQMPAVAPVQKERTAGDVSITSTNWTDFDTGTDIALPNAEPGHVVEAGVLFRANGANSLNVDIATVVSSTPQSYFGSASGTATGDGVAGWNAGNNAFDGRGGSLPKTLVAGDIDGANVLLRVRMRIFSAGSKNVSAGSSLRFVFWARNCGWRIKPIVFAP